MQLQYGTGRTLTINAPPATIVATEHPLQGGIAQSRQSPAEAVSQPLDFPPLSQVVVPGDRIALPLAPGVPGAPQVVAAIVSALLEGGVAGADITIVRTSADAHSGAPDPRSDLPEPLRSDVQLVEHDPDDRDQLSYLAADEQAEPIYISRPIGEADVVIPIGCLRPVGDGGGANRIDACSETLFPTFGNRKAIEHLTPSGVPQSKGQIAHRQKQIDQVAWLLGVQVTTQVVPHPGREPIELLVGTPERVSQIGDAAYRSVWETVVASRAQLVVAAISGEKHEQSWENVGRALHAALALVEDGGAVVLCSDLDRPLGPALRVLAASTDAEAALARLRKSHAYDAPLARMLAESLERVSVYLRSRLDEEVVASIGMANVSEDAEIERLVARSKSCIVLRDAQYALPSVRDDIPTRSHSSMLEDSQRR